MMSARCRARPACCLFAAPVGFTTGGRPQPGNSQQQHYWGQVLHHMAHIPAVLPGKHSVSCYAGGFTLYARMSRQHRVT